MGKLTAISLAIILTVFVLAVFSQFIYDNSPDANKTTFVTYKTGATDEYGSTDDLLSTANTTYQDTGDPILSFAWVDHQIQTSISTTTTSLNNTDTSAIGILNKIAAGFGLIATLVISIAVITLVTIIELIGTIVGVSSNANNLPGDWHVLAGLTTIIVVSALTFASFVIYRSIKVGDNI